MIHAYAIEPAVAATWVERRAFGQVVGSFGAGTPRVMLELPKFSKWKKAVYREASNLSDVEQLRLAELFQVFAACRARRAGEVYSGQVSWLENAEEAYASHPFGAIIAMLNPRHHTAVIGPDTIGDTTDPLWERPRASTPTRQAADLAAAVSGLLTNCSELHIVDPHFGPENRRHRVVLEAMLEVIASRPGAAPEVTVHCLSTARLSFFENSAAKMAERLPKGVAVFFKRWQAQHGGERFHNRYLLTNIGGVTFGVGMDQGRDGQTEDINLMAAAQYRLRWSQYAKGRTDLLVVDQPHAVTGRKPPP